MSARGEAGATGLPGTPGRRMAIAVALTVVSALPRFHDLGEPPLYGDEDYTYLTVHSVLRGEGSVMPSGMPYRRALPFTWANAAAVAVLDEDDPAAYRVVAAVAGTLTPGALYLTATALVAPEAALVAATLLALSEWHGRYSRHGRMYAPFLLVFVLTGHLFWRWVRTGSKTLLGLALASYALALSLHLLGLVATQFALFALVLPGTVAVAPVVVLAVVGAATGLGYAAQQSFVQAPYGAWSLPFGFRVDGVGDAVTEAARTAPWSTIPIVVGAAVGLWLGARLVSTAHPRPRALPALAMGAAAVAAGVFLSAGQLWGATLAMAGILLVRPVRLRDLPHRGGPPLGLALLAGAGWAAFAVASWGPGEAIRRLAILPWPYPIVLWPISPTLLVLFIGACAWLMVGTSDDGASGLRCAALAVLVPMAGLGLIAPQEPPRYLLLTYPYLLLVAAWVVVAAARAALSRLRPGAPPAGAPALALGLVLAGAVGGHGVASALRVGTVDYGRALAPAVYTDPYFVDHETAGRYVRDRLAPDDVVIAEDPIIAWVYAGRAEYWLRRAEDAVSFLYLDGRGIARDKYAGAELLATPAAVERVVVAAPGRVWLLTSGEAAGNPRVYRGPELTSWLGTLADATPPAALGRDGVTAAYCLGCASR